MNEPGPTEAELESAFRTFSELSGNLIQTYQGLESQVHHLSDELASARLEQRRELQEKERLASRLSMLLESLPGGVVVLDGAGRVQECNPAARQLLGEDLEGRAWVDCVRECFRPRPDDGQDVSLTSGRRVNMDTCSLGTEPGQILLLKDVTENRQLQDQLEQLKRLSAMGEMAASLAHQVRTPLASALLYAGGLERNDLSDVDRKRFATKLSGVLGRLELLVQDMLSFARSGNLALERITVQELVEGIRSTLDSSARRGGFNFSLRHDSPGGQIRGNREALISGFQNLFNNAREVVGAELQLQVDCQLRAGERVVFSVRDNGPGIDAEIIDNLFEPFISRRQGGTGLGLAVLRGIVQSHGGSIRACNHDQAGAEFVIELPLTTQN